MTTWNYRVIKERVRFRDKYWDSYVIKTVYYDDNGEMEMWTLDRSSPMGETLKELESDLNKMKEALTKPILQFENDELIEVET